MEKEFRLSEDKPFKVGIGAGRLVSVLARSVESLYMKFDELEAYLDARRIARDLEKQKQTSSSDQ